MAKLLAGIIVAVSFTGFGCSAKPEVSAGSVAAAPPAAPESGAAQTAIQESVKSIVLEQEKKIWEGFKVRDANAISALLADDIQVVTVNGRFNKSGFLRMVPELPEISSYAITNATVISPSEDIAILTYDCEYVAKEGRLVKHSSFQTTVWANRDGNWLAIFNQETPQ